MSIKNYFFPEVLQKFKSKFNSDIELVKFGGHLRLDMGGLTQSGWIIEQIWSKALKKLITRDFSPKNILILGFGAGSSAKLLHKRWPNAKITGVEIDPVVIDISKKYFNVAKIPKLKIVNADAVKFLTVQKPNSFDLILVDCYLGDQVPAKLSSQTFLKKLTQVSDKVLINRLFWTDYQKKTIDWLDLLEKNFSYETCRTTSNLVIALKEK